ncbi:MAG TPA: family 1 glycosylhydrolase [Myxococcaceae bacterium]|nr:family 1 glycosylhydrolase [Myxococcaceae bacterium]
MKCVFRIAATALALIACEGRVRFSPEDIARADLGNGLPSGFLLGAATASAQVEGGLDNNWTDWAAGSYPDGRPHIEGGQQIGLSTDSWNKFSTHDLPALVQLKANSYRLSIEWSRVEPSRGAFDQTAIDRYSGWMKALRANGITPMVTLNHFSLPKWVVEQGGWESDQTAIDFEAYAARMAQALGADVDLWCTINEPNVYAVLGYLDGVWPPGVEDGARMARVIDKQIDGHARAARALREHDLDDADGDGKATMIGIAHHMFGFQPASSSILDTMVAGATDDFFNESVVRAVLTGRVDLVVPGVIEIHREAPLAKGSFDYLGLNYYRREFLRADLGRTQLAVSFVPEGEPTNDLGWSLYPEGFYAMLVRASRWELPVFVTENGTAANEPGSDGHREFLRDHVYAMERAIADGANVRGYYYWSLMDNFEWDHGYNPKMGLFRVNFDDPDLTRVPTSAVELFAEIATRAAAQ